MAYSIHIFRGSDWTSEPDEPITADELLAVESIAPYQLPPVQNPKTGEMLTGTIKGMYTYRNGADEIPVQLKKGILYAECSDKSTPEKLLPLAEALHAKIQGDEGEFYS